MSATTIKATNNIKLLFSRYSIQSKLVSDNRPKFKSDGFKTF